MAKFISFEGKHVCFGLTWGRINNPKKIKSEVASFIQRHKSDLYITCKSSDLIKVGSCAKGTLKGKEAIFSAAALFASTFTEDDMPAHAMLLLPVEDEYSLIALVNGVPYLDILISAKDVALRIANLEQESGDHYEIYGEGPENISGVSTLELADLFGQGNEKLAKLGLKKPGTPFLLILVTLGVIGFFGYDFWEQEQARIKLEEAQKNTVDPVAAYKASLKSQLANAAFTGTDAIKNIWKPVSAIEISSAGWLLSDLECTRSACKGTWKNKNGTTKAFELANQKGANKLLPDGITIENSFPVQSAINAIDPSTLPGQTTFQQELKAKEETAKLIGVSFKTKLPTMYAVPKEITASQVPQNLAVLKGEVSIEGPLGLLEEYLHQPSNVAFSHISMKIDSGVTAAKFKIVGDYFVKH